MTFGIGYGRSQKLAFFIVFAAAISCIFLLISSGSKAADYAIQFGPSSDVMTSEFQITLRDSVTGANAAGQIVTTSGDGTAISESTNSTGHSRFSVAPGRKEIEISSPGYTSLTTHFEFNQPELKVTAWLDPVETPSEMRSEAISSKIVADKILLHGHVYDEAGVPVKAARVYLEKSKIEAFTDAHGYFQMSAPLPPVDPAGDMPSADDLSVELGGRIIYMRTNMLLPEGATHLILDIDRQNFKVKDETHKLKLSREELGQTQYERTAGDSEITTTTDERPASVVVPTSIRVGSSCPSKSTCTVFNVYSLDTYTRLGLDDEWISSWNTNSLKAGAIAFRSYGVYHVFHPLTANYDICNTTSCQVMDPTDSSAAVDLATAQTSGSIVVDASGANPFFAEYAAENNANLCPDGMTGNNGSWPCMSDPVDVGQTFNGHGRGMCQWGTQRWSVNQGKDFVWIVDHYYNNNGNPGGLRTGILQTSPNTVLPPPTLAAPGVSNLAPGTTISTLTPTFEWQPVAGADGYGLYISKFNGSTYDVVYNSENAIGQPITGTTLTLPAGFLVMNAQYRWNMSAHNTAGYGSANTFRSYFAVSPPVTISGRVRTPDGPGLKNANVTLTDASGTTRRVMTNNFGIFTFDTVTPGQTYTIAVTSKRFRFASQSVQVTSDLTVPDFMGQE